MLQIKKGQCGLCRYFGEHNNDQPVIVSIRKSHEAEEDHVEDCAHPEHAPLNLKVTAISGCKGFEEAIDQI